MNPSDTDPAAHTKSMSTSRQPKGIPAGGQFAATTHAEPDHVHLLGRPDDDFENAVQQIGFHAMAATRWREEGMTIMREHTPEAWERSQLYLTAHRAVDRAACRVIDAAKLPRWAYEFRGFESMDRYAPRLEAALEMVDAEYKASLPNVKNGGLFRATELDITRKALKYEIEQNAAT